MMLLSLPFFIGIILLFVYDNIDVFSSCRCKVYLKEKLFWTYIAARVLVLYVLSVVLSYGGFSAFNISQDISEPIFGIILFLFMIGLIQNFTLRLGDHDIGGFLRLFGTLRSNAIKEIATRQKSIQKEAKKKVENEKRELQVKLETLSLQELERNLHSCYASAFSKAEDKTIAMSKLENLTNGLSEENKKPYYAIEIVRSGGINATKKILERLGIA
jgi:hypothetical protein